jgi:membrane protease YdiL (CAAX protease family)
LNTTNTPRSIQILRFLGGSAWLFLSTLLAGHAAQGIATRLRAPSLEALLQQVFLVFLLIVGFSLPYGISRPNIARTVNALPKRTTSVQEFLGGAALGWGMLLVALLPMMAAGALHPQFSFSVAGVGLTLLSLATIAAGTLALEIAFRGYLFIRLIAIFGEVGATLFLSLVYAVLSGYHPNATGVSVAVTFATGIVFSLAYLRTHGLWLGWGMHFAWNASMAVLFGLPLAGYATYASPVSTDVSGPLWLTGGAYGPEAATLTLLVLIAAVPLLYRITRDYAWEYTHAPIVAAGYAMEVAPPEAHTAMEAAAAAKPAPLVQILGSTPTASSTMPVIDEHLRSQNNSSSDPS